MKIGDLVYIPADVKLIQFHDNIKHINPKETYIGASPVRVYTLKKPSNLLLVDLGKLGEKYIKVLYGGDEWYVEKQDVSKNIF
jgi:hypothetical protein